MSVRPTRAELFARIKPLRDRGCTYREIAEALAMKEKTVRGITNDPDGAKDRARKDSYRGMCVECGAPTSGSNGRAKAPLRCLDCSLGRTPERPSEPSKRRTHPIRLCDLPLEVRLEGAHAANRIEQGIPERQEILLAAILPSDRVYWLAPSALPRINALMAAAA